MLQNLNHAQIGAAFARSDSTLRPKSPTEELLDALDNINVELRDSLDSLSVRLSIALHPPYPQEQANDVKVHGTELQNRLQGAIETVSRMHKQVGELMSRLSI